MTKNFLDPKTLDLLQKIQRLQRQLAGLWTDEKYAGMDQRDLYDLHTEISDQLGELRAELLNQTCNF